MVGSGTEGIAVGKDPGMHQFLDPGTVVLTANIRLAAELRRRFDREREGGGEAAWESPDILSMAGWMRRCWDDLCDAQTLGDVQWPDGGAPPVLLSPRQGLVVWEEVVAASSHSRNVLYVSGVAALALGAWEMLQAWKLPISQSISAPGEGTTPEVRAFADWATAYEERCRGAGWMSTAGLAGALEQAFAAKLLPPPGRVILAGFEDLPPNTRSLLDTLRNLGTHSEELPDPERAGQARLAAYPGGEEEIRAAALWARYWMEQSLADKAAGTPLRVGIVVPDLTAQRSRVERIFTDVFLPGTVFPGAMLPAAVLPAAADPAAADPATVLSATVLPASKEIARPFNISLGLPLGAYPVIEMALTLLGLTPGRVALGTLAGIIASPFLAGAETEMLARTRLDLRIRRWRSLEVSLAAVQALATEQALDSAQAVSTEQAVVTKPALAAGEGEQDQAAGERPPWHAPQLAAALERWRLAFDALPPRQSPSRWAAAFAGLLRALGWPGERARNSGEHQTVNKWLELLEAYSRLDLVVEEHTRAEALGCVTRMAAEEVFQPKSPDAPVQIMGVLEAGGMAFDHLWVLGLDDEHWPPVPRPNTFLPLALQRRHGMPRASVERELELARKQTQRLLQSAPDVVISFPRGEEGRALRPSALIEDLPRVEEDSLPAAAVAELAELIASSGPSPGRSPGADRVEALEQMADFMAPPLPLGIHPRGGTNLFRDQAACPFRACALHRLHATAPETPGAGLDPGEQGTLAHAALEKAWSRIEDQATLAGLSEKALASILRESAQAALAEMRERRPDKIGPRLAALETTRLVPLMSVLMEQEKLRAPFRVEKREETLTLDVGGVSVTGRVDRIDRLPDGGEVVIDYKTGQAGIGQWEGERPDEPQLPIYASGDSMHTVGVAFARLSRKFTGYAGVAEDPGLFPGATRIDEIPVPGGPPLASFSDLVAHWRGILEKLGEDFRGGVARVDPKDPRRNCKYCGLMGLCRIGELHPSRDFDMEDPDGLGVGIGAETGPAGEEGGGNG